MVLRTDTAAASKDIRSTSAQKARYGKSRRKTLNPHRTCWHRWLCKSISLSGYLQVIVLCSQEQEERLGSDSKLLCHAALQGESLEYRIVLKWADYRFRPNNREYENLRTRCIHFYVQLESARSGKVPRKEIVRHNRAVKLQKLKAVIERLRRSRQGVFVSGCGVPSLKLHHITDQNLLIRYLNLR